jgi:hypothetical protein
VIVVRFIFGRLVHIRLLAYSRPSWLVALVQGQPGRLPTSIHHWAPASRLTGRI